jgi:two-component system heavy metal sensor histidine kinase CusS
MAIHRRSLTLRLTLLFAATSTIVLVLIGWAFYLSLGAHFLHEDAIELAGKIELLGNLVRRVEREEDVAMLTERLQDALFGHHNLALDLVTPDGRVVYADDVIRAIADRPRSRVAENAVDGLVLESIEVDGHDYRVTRLALPTRLSSAPRLLATLAMNVDHHQAFMSRVRNTTVLSVLLGIALAAMLGWITSRIGLSPLRGFSSLTARTSAERLDARLALQELPHELVPLGESFNAMLQRLDDSFRRLREFASDLAHELRTPISALMTQAEVALSRSRSADDYREVLYSAMEEYDRLARMISDMLFLARSDNGLLIPSCVRIDVRDEVLALYDFYDALVESKQIRLQVTGSEVIDGDRLMIRRALANLLANAIRHAKPGTTVITALGQSAGKVSITVTNVGDPIPAEHLPRLFDRFYRVDPARERSVEGTGLGLAITNSIVAAHGGTISATSAGETSQFAIELPAATAGTGGTADVSTHPPAERSAASRNRG